MSLKNKFLRFCEMHRNANAIREEKGPHHARTIQAYDEMNRQKRIVLDAIDELEEHKFMYESVNK